MQSEIKASHPNLPRI